VISRGRFVRQLPVVPPLLADELLSSWLTRTSSYYRTSAKELLKQIGCIETSLEVLDRSAGAADLAALAFALRVDPTELLNISFNAVPEPVLNFISPWAKLRECPRCSVDSTWANPRQKDSNNHVGDVTVMPRADRRSVGWLCRHGGMRLPACWAAGDGQRAYGEIGCWRADRRAVCGRAEIVARPGRLSA
jgi:hypothetical protein